MNTKLFLLPLLLAPTLAACSSSGTDSFDAHINGNLHLSFDNGALVVTAPGHPDAHIAQNGDFRIGDNAIALTPPQRDLLQHFYGEAMSVRDDGIATGKAGAALGVHAIGSVLDGLFSGNSDKIDRDMDARGKTVETAALHLCGDLQHLKITQSQLATQLPAFEPYAVFRGEIRCDRHSDRRADVDRDRIRDEIRDSVRAAVRDTVSSSSVGTPAPSTSTAQ
ncbi:MAG TPA: hypothetical protein VN725_07520 [Rhodanobacteraceae bacterium]|nr:hypothetical protein [Rhodanobacteraceae bacterium]